MAEEFLNMIDNNMQTPSSPPKTLPVFDDLEHEWDLLGEEWSLLPISNDGCTCGHCPSMPTMDESVCCQEVPQVMAVIEQEPGKTCITQHNGFHPVCLHRSVLRTAYYVYRQHYEELPETNGRMRYIGYRQLARWCWGYLGKNVRVPLPACAVSLIRTTYPEESGQYHGFTPC